MKAEEIRASFLPWCGPALGTLGFFLGHQLGTDATFPDCRVGSPLIVTLGTILALLIIGRGALGSWRVHSGDTGRARKLVATVGLLACGLYAIGVILPFIAALVIPRCWA